MSRPGTDRLALAVAQVHHSATRVGRLLLDLAERHRGDHEVHHVCHDLVTWSREHVAGLARAGRDHGLDLAADLPDAGDGGRPGGARDSGPIGDADAPGLVLLADLRLLYLEASGASLDWEVLAQSAQGLVDRELLALATRCHPQALRVVRFANARLKESAPQALAAPR
ncbi:hypothetical protein [Geodermatophilus sp. DSM 44513]|uniref:hypothetical protein n=1 Tax=Geodermatophilus sp. DSM 44513 TaxID=1528104 RepID=UPI00127860F2|nr:hypothetical protein [Geodermatophilus sp. DSM 44513]WNV73760.1 hypothetical protein RTG05_12285 [Geodermatophilus sp. DSM 44513]